MNITWIWQMEITAKNLENQIFHGASVRPQQCLKEEFFGPSWEWFVPPVPMQAREAKWLDPVRNIPVNPQERSKNAQRG
jgi:hypothetical protein